MDESARISLLKAPVPRSALLRVVTVAPGERLAYVEDDWHDALVVVEHGRLEIECRAGGRRRFTEGTVLWLTGLPVRTLHNPGPGAAVLTAVARRARATDEFSRRDRSEPA